MPKSCFLIANPVSGSSSPQKLQHVMEELTARGLAPELLLTTKADDAPIFAERICREEDDPTIIVAGGDGTINGVLNGLLPGRATLGILPMGTSNVLARELGVRTLEDAISRVARGESRPISVGELAWDKGKCRFVLMAGIGVDGAVVEGVRLHEKRVLGKGAYLLSALRILLSWERDEVLVRSGDKSLSCHSVIVCNACRYAGDFLLAPRADLFAPELQVVCIRGGRLAYLKLALMLGAGSVSRCRQVTVFPARELQIAGMKPIQVDGDYCRRGPATVRSLPEFLRLIV